MAVPLACLSKKTLLFISNERPLGESQPAVSQLLAMPGLSIVPHKSTRKIDSALKCLNGCINMRNFGKGKL